MKAMKRNRAMNGTVTGGARVYSFETPRGTHLLPIELCNGLIVGSDGMYHYDQGK
ncbi:MAG: hypothetical protein J6U01_04600 [Clostridia bacterium]|nr:hypothetical protein [Clostridia bacterium]